jgi:hypothetical protein
MLEAVVIPDVLADERVEEWRRRHPREWWAFRHLDREDEMRGRVLAAILGCRTNRDPALDDLMRYADALENRQRAQRAGTASSPPVDGGRRPFQAQVTRMTLMRSERCTFYRVDFVTPHGWSGTFDTTNPVVVERISKQRDLRKPVTLIGEITRRPYEFLVELGAHVRIL